MARKLREELMLQRAGKLLAERPARIISPESRKYWTAHSDRIKREAREWSECLARELLRATHSAVEAHKLLDAVAETTREPHRPQEADSFTVVVAEEIQQRTSCDKRAALRQAMAVLGVPAKTLRRLEDKLRGKTLQQFVEALPFKPHELSLTEFMAEANSRSRPLAFWAYYEKSV
jgi:hypothetical protein